MKRSLFLAAVLSTLAVGLPAVAEGKGEATYYYGENGDGSTLRFFVQHHRADEIGFTSHGRCFVKGKEVKRGFEASLFGHGRVSPDGSFRRHASHKSDFDPGHGPGFERTLVARTSPDGGTATVRIKWEQPVGPPGTGKFAECDTGKVGFELGTVSRHRFAQIVDESGMHTNSGF
jgi:hypothetical protein